MRCTAPGATPAGVRSARYRNFGLARIVGSASRMPASKSAALAAARVERHRRGEVLLRDRTAVRAPRQLREDRVFAHALFVRAAPPGCRRSTRWRLGVSPRLSAVNGPSTSTLPISRDPLFPGAGHGTLNSTSSDSANVRATNVTPSVCGPAVVFTGMFWNRSLIGRDRRRLLLVDGLQVLGTTDRVLEDLDAVEQHHHRVLILHAAQVAGDAAGR